MFFFKRLVGGLVQPAPLVLILMGLALLLLLLNGRRRRAAGLVCLGLFFLLLLLAAFPQPARFAARRLERAFNPVSGRDAIPFVPYGIAILGNGVEHPGDPALPALTRLNAAARARLTEGVRLAVLFPEARLFVCGFGLGLEACADAMAEAAVELGVAPSRIDRLAHVRDTREEAEAVAALADGKPFLVVTSAAHMARAMFAFQALGARAAAAPCDFLAPVSDDVLTTVNRRRWLPSGASLTANAKIWHEIMGLIHQRAEDGG